MNEKLKCYKSGSAWLVIVPAGWVTTIEFKARFSTFGAAARYMRYWANRWSFLSVERD